MNVRPWKPPPKAITPERPGVRARDLDRVLDRLRTGRDEDGLLGRRTGCEPIQPLGQFHGHLVRRDHEARVRECFELLCGRRLHRGMDMTGVDHRDAGGKIDVTAALYVPELRVTGPLDEHRQLICDAAGDGRIAPLLQILVPGHRRHLGQCVQPRLRAATRDRYSENGLPNSGCLSPNSTVASR